jgi:hypothetical protein
VADESILAAIGAAIVGFGIVAFVFRIQREIDLRPRARWIPWADRLLIGIVIVALLLVLFPIALAETVSNLWGKRLPAAASSASTVALAGYIPALLAHYCFGPRYRQVHRSDSRSVERRDQLEAGAQPDDQGAASFRRWSWGGLLAHYRSRPHYQRIHRSDNRSVERPDQPEPGAPPELRDQPQASGQRDHEGAAFPRRWIWFGPLVSGDPRPGEDAEKAIVIASAILGLIAATLSFVVTG